jgi:hypothetical protein
MKRQTFATAIRKLFPLLSKLGVSGTNRRIIFKNYREWDVRLWAGFNRLWVGSCIHGNELSGSIKGG